MTSSGPILLTYDGSQRAEHAIRVAGTILPGGEAIVVHIWELPTASAILPAPDAPALAIRDLDLQAEAERERARAQAVVEQGVRIAAESGFTPTPLLLEGAGKSGTWSQIVRAAERHGVTAIVMGARERHGWTAVLFGSVTDGVTHHAPCPVLVVPPEH